MSSYVKRLVRAARLEPEIYEEVEADRSATVQALCTVVLSSLAAAVGATGQQAGLRAGFLAAAGALALWVVWAAVIWFVGTRILPEPQTRSDVGELLRTTGFAAAPGLLRALGFIPFLSVPVAVVVAFWMLAAMVVAVRQALDFSGTWRAVFVCGLGLFAYFGVVIVLGILLGATEALFEFVVGRA
jgi:hypothetical protein